jgi:predicted dehydrogenase
MGGVEANCHLRLRFEGFEANVRLSRDWALPNDYIFECSKGWLRWNATEAEALQIGLHGSTYALDTRLHDAGLSYGHPVCAGPSSNLEQSFVDQLSNAVHAVRGLAEIEVPGEIGLQSLRLIEQCYRNRQLMDMGWLSEAESAAAQRLGSKA